MTARTIYEVIDYIDETAKSTVERGEMWEKVTTYYLRSDPQQRQVMGDVWRWSDAPTNDGQQDTGIDIVSEYTVDYSEDVRYWAVQCKNYSPKHKYDLKDVSTFFSKAQADKRYAGYVLSLTSDFITKNLEDLCEQNGTTVITPSVMAMSNIDWSGVFSSGSAGERLDFNGRFSRACGSVQRATEATYVIGWGAATKDLTCMSVIDGAAGEELLSVSIDDPQNFTYRCVYCE